MRTTEGATSAVVAPVGAPSSQTLALSFHLMPARSQSALVRGCPAAACVVSAPEGGSAASIEPVQTLAFSSQTNVACSQPDRVKGWYAYAPLAKAAPITSKARAVNLTLDPP